MKQVYVESRKRLEEGKQSKWCADTKAILLHNIGMGEAWTKQQWTTEEHKQWDSRVWEAVNQKEEPVERVYDAENKTENIPNYQTDTDIRTVLEQQRQAGETDDDETERRNE